MYDVVDVYVRMHAFLFIYGFHLCMCTFTLSQLCTISLSLSLSLSLSHTHTHTRARAHTHTHTHTYDIAHTAGFAVCFTTSNEGADGRQKERGSGVGWWVGAEGGSKRERER